MNITTEQIDHLTKDEQTVLRCMERQASYFGTMDRAEAELRAWFPVKDEGWLVYRGGHHIAIHRTAGDDRRCLLVTE